MDTQSREIPVLRWFYVIENYIRCKAQNTNTNPADVSILNNNDRSRQKGFKSCNIYGVLEQNVKRKFSSTLFHIKVNWMKLLKVEKLLFKDSY